MSAATATLEHPSEHPAERSLDELIDAICVGAANLTAAEHRWLELIAEFDRRKGWADSGCADGAAWLCWMVGLDRRTAREKLRVAHALHQLPECRAAMAAGQLTYSKARALTRIAVPENESTLLNVALAGTSNHVERVVTAYRRQAGATQSGEQVAHHTRGLWVRYGDGDAELTLRLPTEAMVTVLGAIELFLDQDDEPPAGRRSRAARLADAVCELAATASAADVDEVHTDQPRYLANVHVDAEGLTDDSDERGRCHVAADHADDGQPLAVPVTTARRLLCDAALQRVTHASDGSIDLGRRSRVVRGRLKRALRERDGCCRFPGCHRRAWLDAHHQVHWTDGGATDLDNTLLLCGYHHRLVHEGGWRVEGDPNGALTFIAADGTALPGAPPRFLGSAMPVHQLGRTARDGRCQWDGTPLDLHAVLDGNIHAPPAA